MLNGLTSSAIMLLVEQANLDIENWTTNIFGKVENDDEGNSSLKQNYIARDSDNNSKIDAYKNLAKKDYDSLSEDEQKKFNDLSELIVTVRDGKLGEWIGYAPQFKNGKDNAGNEDKDLSMELSKGRDWNVKHSGSGQMGKIMLDFQWNNMIEQQGWQKVALPAYDQPLCRGDCGWFEPPTIRGVASIVFEDVGQVSGQTWFSYADDVIFAAIDHGNLLSGDWVNKESKTGKKALDDGGKWWAHSYPNDNLNSDGCDIYTTADRIDLQNVLKEWGVHGEKEYNGKKYYQQIKVRMTN